jgi:hypothetical protein
MKPIATDTADFPSLRKDGCIYVDKTMYMQSLIAPKRALCGLLAFPSIPSPANSWILAVCYILNLEILGRSSDVCICV